MGTQPRKTRGLFERPACSGIWWINYFVKGKQHREKVGRKSDAIALYQKRKADARRGEKLPELRPQKVTTFGELANGAVDYAKVHLKTWADYDWKERALREPLGSRPAGEITPQEIDRLLTEHCRTPATANRFRAFFSLCYRLGMENGKVMTNPARLVRMRRENNARLRYLSRDEYKKLSGIILRGNPRQHPAFSRPEATDDSADADEEWFGTERPSQQRRRRRSQNPAETGKAQTDRPGIPGGR